MVAAGRGHHLGGMVLEQRVERAPDLEHAGDLQVLELESDRAAVSRGAQHRRAPDVRGYPRRGGTVGRGSRRRTFWMTGNLSGMHTVSFAQSLAGYHETPLACAASAASVKSAAAPR